MIVVAGDALVDLLARPDGSITAVPGGGSYNAARAIGRLGLPVAFLGSVSDDRFGRLLADELAADGVSLDLLRRTDLPTTLALAELDASGGASYRFYVDGTSAPALGRDPLPPLPPGTRAVLTGTLGLVLEPMASAIEAFVAGLADDVLLLVDPNCRPSITPDPEAFRVRVTRVLARADVVKASAEDLAFLRPGVDALGAIRWIASLGPRAVVVTDGGGPVRVHAAGLVATIEPPRVDVVDTVGAGDAFAGALLGALVHAGIDRSALTPDAALRAARLATRAAAMTCTRAGAVPPTLDELGGWPD